MLRFPLSCFPAFPLNIKVNLFYFTLPYHLMLLNRHFNRNGVHLHTFGNHLQSIWLTCIRRQFFCLIKTKLLMSLLFTFHITCMSCIILIWWGLGQFRLSPEYEVHNLYAPCLVFACWPMPHICPGWGVCIGMIISESFAFFVSNAYIVFFMTRSSSFFLNVNFMSNLISVVFKQVCLLINYLQVLIFLGFYLKNGCT